MKLPLHIHHKYPQYDKHAVVDANGKVMCTVNTNDLKFAKAVVRKFNRNFQYRLFNKQSYAASASNPERHISQEVTSEKNYLSQTGKSR